MNITERLENATTALLAELVVVEEMHPGLTDEQVRELLEWRPQSHTI